MIVLRNCGWNECAEERRPKLERRKGKSQGGGGVGLSSRRLSNRARRLFSSPQRTGKGPSGAQATTNAVERARAARIARANSLDALGEWGKPRSAPRNASPQGAPPARDIEMAEAPAELVNGVAKGRV